MHDDTSDPRDMRDPNHIWLRQSVTFAVNGQTRTLELALPLRPGATPEEVESLLDEAEAGMRRLSHRLDAHLAEITGAAQPTTAPATPPPPQPAATATPPAPVHAPEAAPEAAATPAPRHSPSPQPTAAPAQSIAERPAPRPAAPATPVAPSRATHPAPPTSGGPDLTRAEFLAATGALGLDARTVMERLNVRSLNGLNLREALDLLRRQLVREGDAEASEPPAATPEEHAMPAPIGRPRFDEEDDSPEFELSYPDPEELPGDDDFAGEDEFAPLEVAPAPPARSASARPAPIAASADPLGDVPDLDDLLGAPVTPPAPAAAEPELAVEPAVARAREMIAALRASHPGGQPTEHQRNAYKNIVIDQIGETKAAGVARAVWNLTPERLGPEQLDALIRWGKADAFADEVEDMLALLRAEYLAQKAQQAQQSPAAPATSAAPAAPTRRAPQRPAPEASQPAEPEPATRPATRGRPAAPRGNASGNTGATRGGAGSQGGA